MKARGKRNVCGDRILKLDLYREVFQFQLPNGSAHYRTFLGAILSCITVSLIGLFAVYKLIALATIEDYRVQKDLYV